MDKWDERFLGLARLVASWSKDPSTQTGSVIVDAKHRVRALGFNGFPMGVADDARLLDRQKKYKMVVHAEVNAIISASSSLTGCTAYVVPWPPCGPCAAALIQAGIARVVSQPPTAQQRERWKEDWDVAETMLAEAGVSLEFEAAI